MASSNQSVGKHDYEENYKEVDFLLGKAEGTSCPEAHRLIGLEVATVIKKLRMLMVTLAAEMYRAGQEDAADIRERYEQIQDIVQSGHRSMKKVSS